MIPTSGKPATEFATCTPPLIKTDKLIFCIARNIAVCDTKHIKHPDRLRKYSNAEYFIKKLYAYHVILSITNLFFVSPF